ncbi:response regulator [Streptomyces formicae]|uniref:Response regulator n=1 Tax=Streptomyces formicae TaxID=1616117 RepID=A0ABY3WKX4_9ACTN|nr:response regulator [Streptomyces formicae]UNM12251.1 response regulator [Streptomyces formicae]
MSSDRTGIAPILIVDDIEENLTALEAVLGSLDHVVRAHSGEDALKAMLRQEFAVVLLDVRMPDMDGFETAANIRHLDQTKDVPIILLTGVDADADYAYRGYSVGAADFLTKPIDPWLLRTKVNVFLELHRKNRQLAAQAEQLRQLLVRDNSPSPAAPEAMVPTATDQHEDAHSPHVTSSASAPGNSARSAGNVEPLTEIAERLAQIELLLRDSDGQDGATLADRISGIERDIDRAIQTHHSSRHA